MCVSWLMDLGHAQMHSVSWREIRVSVSLARCAEVLLEQRFALFETAVAARAEKPAETDGRRRRALARRHSGLDRVEGTTARWMEGRAVSRGLLLIRPATYRSHTRTIPDAGFSYIFTCTGTACGSYSRKCHAPTATVNVAPPRALATRWQRRRGAPEERVHGGRSHAANG